MFAGVAEGGAETSGISKKRNITLKNQHVETDNGFSKTIANEQQPTIETPQNHRKQRSMLGVER
jgi:hypothetical protein